MGVRRLGPQGGALAVQGGPPAKAPGSRKMPANGLPWNLQTEHSPSHTLI